MLSRKINELLYPQFPERTQEGVKGQSRKLAHKEAVTKLVAE